MQRVVLCVLTAIGLSLIPVGILGTTIHVPTDQITIQAGIDAASPGDTVLVAPGTYFENISLRGKAILVTSHFVLDGNPEHIFATIIDGSQPVHPDTASVVRMITGESHFTTFQGFTITGGTGTVWLDPHGAGTYREGGGILTEGSSVIIQYNYIVDNEAIAGGPGYPGLVNAGGGGIRSGDGAPTIRNNIIVNNRGNYGSGIVLNYCPARIENNIVAHNTAGNAYGGACLWAFGTMTITSEITNNTFIYNTGSGIGGGGGVLMWQTAKNLRNNIFWHNLPLGTNLIDDNAVITVNYCNVQGGWPTGTGNINVDPLLGGNYGYLRDGSPSIDTGDPAALYNDKEDASAPGSALWPSRGTLRNDMGAYGGPRGFSFELIVAAADPLNGWAPLHVDAESYTALNVSNWDWDFGDDNHATGAQAANDYISAGIFSVSVTANTTGGTVVANLNTPIIVLADTISAEVDSALAGDPVVVEITARNHVPLSRLVIPIEYGGGDYDLVFDSVSTTGARTDYFASVSIVNSDPANSRVTVELKSSTGGPEPELAAGSGPVLYVYFTVPPEAQKNDQATVALDGYLTYLPFCTGSLIEYNPIDIAGTVTALNCCVGIIRGNINGDPGDGIDVSDVTFLVNYMFKGGSTPPCPDETNVDGAGGSQVNIADLTLLVSYMFKSGPAPAACP